MSYYDWRGNEDAGDLEMMGAADASAYQCGCGRWKDEMDDYCRRCEADDD